MFLAWEGIWIRDPYMKKKKKRFYSTHTLAITAQTRDKKKKKTGHSNYVKNKLRVEFAREVFIKAPPM